MTTEDRSLLEDLLTQCVAVIEDLLQRRPAQRSYRVGRQLIHAIRSREAMAAKAAQKEHAAELATKRMRAKLASPEAQEANDWAETGGLKPPIVPPAPPPSSHVLKSPGEVSADQLAEDAKRATAKKRSRKKGTRGK